MSVIVEVIVYVDLFIAQKYGQFIHKSFVFKIKYHVANICTFNFYQSANRVKKYNLIIRQIIAYHERPYSMAEIFCPGVVFFIVLKIFVLPSYDTHFGSKKSCEGCGSKRRTFNIYFK